MQDTELGAGLFADGGGQPQGQLGAGTAAHRHQHTPDRRRVGSDQHHIAGRVDQDILDRIHPEAVLARALAGAGLEHQQVGVSLEDGLPDTLRGDMRDADLTAKLTRSAFRIAGDAGKQRAIGSRHLDPLTQGPLRGHLDDAE